MQVFDASSMIYGWDNYPENQFPGLWEWIAEQIHHKSLVMPSIAFDEVLRNSPDCGKWLKDNNLQLLEISGSILNAAMRIKGLLGIVNDNYHAKGVGENDIIIIATAREHHVELVSNESRQINLPQELKKYKIPAVCLMPGVAVTCINFIEYIKKSDAIFR